MTGPIPDISLVPELKAALAELEISNEYGCKKAVLYYRQDMTPKDLGALTGMKDPDKVLRRFHVMLGAPHARIGPAVAERIKADMTRILQLGRLSVPARQHVEAVVDYLDLLAKDRLPEEQRRELRSDSLNWHEPL